MAYYGIYRGMVLNSADPLMKGRLMISIPSIAAAPSSWAAPCRDYKSTATPPVGTEVWVMFERGEAAYPVWMGCNA